MDRQADILAARATPFEPAPLVPGGMRVNGFFYASAELEAARVADAGPTVLATADPADPTFAFAIIPGTLRVVRAEVVLTPSQFIGRMLALVRVIDRMGADIEETSR